MELDLKRTELLQTAPTLRHCLRVIPLRCTRLTVDHWGKAGERPAPLQGGKVEPPRARVPRRKYEVLRSTLYYLPPTHAARARLLTTHVPTRERSSS